MPKRGTRASSTDPEAVLAAASAALGRKLEQPVHLINPEQIESPHFLARCGVEGTDRISSVIVKQITSDEFTDPGPESSVSTRLLNELSTLQFLESRRVDGPWPTLWVADEEIGLIVIEDVGEHPSILSLLLGDDPGAARTSLVGMGQTLAELHLAGLSQVRHFEAFQRRRGAMSPRSDSTRRLSDISQHVRDALETLEIDPASGFWEELDEIDRTFTGIHARPTVIHADAGPQNFLAVGEDRVVILDFEFAVPGHPALDLVSARLGFPHTKKSHPVMPGDVELVESAYRAQVGGAMNWAMSDDEFGKTVTDACASWAVGRWGSQWPSVFTPGASSGAEAHMARRRGIILYEAFIATAERFDRRRAVAETMRHYVGAVSGLWNGIEPMERYPALR